MSPPGIRKLAVAAAGVLLAACRPDTAAAPRNCAPQILASAVDANATNVLSAVVTSRIRHADSVAVRFGEAPASLDSVTDGVDVSARGAALDAPNGDTVTAPVLGLEPHTSYALQLRAYNECGVTAGEMLSFTSGALPADLPTYRTSGPDPTPGFVAFSATPYGLVIDNTGRVVWYHRFPNGPGLNFQPQPTGRYAARPPTPPGEVGYWFEIDALGNVVSTLTCAHGLQPRFHDLIALADGSYWLMCDDTRTMNLSVYGGVSNAQVTGTVIQHIRADGSLLFEWSAFDHFAITDLDSLDRMGASVNWTHGNAIDLDADGNLIASFRSLSEITKINTTTGAVVWRMGGHASQFAFQSAPTPLFARQHGVRVMSSGELQLLDNLSDPNASRAKRVSYRPDGVPSAWQAGAYESQPPVIAMLGGSTQELPGGRLLVAYGNGNRVEEYDAVGHVVWRIDGNSGYVFRAERIRSLYKPGAGLHR